MGKAVNSPEAPIRQQQIPEDTFPLFVPWRENLHHPAAKPGATVPPNDES